MYAAQDGFLTIKLNFLEVMQKWDAEQTALPNVEVSAHKHSAKAPQVAIGTLSISIRFVS